jgi:predicted RNA binding protein YcfA (HicA-like mRNA interferase family)
VRIQCVSYGMDRRALIKLLEQDGWVLDRVTGSHHHFRHAAKPGTVTIPHPKPVISKWAENMAIPFQTPCPWRTP